MRVTRSSTVSKVPSRRLRFGLGLFGVGVLVLMVWVGFNSPNTIPGRGYYTVKVQFANADNIAAHSSIRMGGRLVGQALDPRVENGMGTIDLQLNTDVKPLRDDSKIFVRPRSLVGVRYLDLVPGAAGAPIPEHGTIRMGKASTPVGLDEVLDTLDARSRKDAQVMLQQLGGGVLSRGDDVNETLGHAEPLLRQTRDVASAIRSRPGATGRFVTGAAQLATAVAPVRDALAQGFADESRAMRPFSEHADGLRGTLAQAPATLQTARDSLPAVDGLLEEAGGAARAAKPTLRALPEGLRQATRLLRDSRPALLAAPKTLRLARAATPNTIAALKRLTTALPLVDDLTTHALPFLEEFAPRACDVTSFAGHWANMDSYGDALGNYLRFDVFGADEESLLGATKLTQGLTEQIPATRVLQNPYPAPCTAGNEDGRDDPGGTVPNDGLPETGVALP